MLLVRVVAGSTLHDKEVSAHIHSAQVGSKKRTGPLEDVAQVTDQGEIRRHLLRKALVGPKRPHVVAGA